MDCISCGGKEFRKIAINATFAMPRDVLRCYSCGLAAVHPLPQEKELDSFYAQQYSLGVGDRSSHPLAEGIAHLFHYLFLEFRIKTRLMFLQKNKISLSGKRILEIGSGNGAFLNALRKKGASVEGIEPSMDESKISVKRFHITPIGCRIKDVLSMNQGSYDIIFCYHVLEHLREPLVELGRIRQLLKKDGLFIGEVPFWPQNPDLFDSATRKDAFDNLHLYHFTAMSISNLLRSAEFSDIRIERIGFYSAFSTMYPQANVHYLYPSFKKPFKVKFFSFLQAIELWVKNFFGGTALDALEMEDLNTEWRGPNDWLRFRARA